MDETSELKIVQAEVYSAYHIAGLLWSIGEGNVNVTGLIEPHTEIVRNKHYLMNTLCLERAIDWYLAKLVAKGKILNSDIEYVIIRM